MKFVLLYLLCGRLGHTGLWHRRRNDVRCTGRQRRPTEWTDRPTAGSSVYGAL